MAAKNDTVFVTATKSNSFNYDHLHEEYVEYSTLGLICVTLVSLGILIIGLGIFIKYVMESRDTMRRLSISSQYAQQRSQSSQLPTVPSGVMLLPPDSSE